MELASSASFMPYSTIFINWSVTFWIATDRNALRTSSIVASGALIHTLSGVIVHRAVGPARPRCRR
jgi:hypothetical protein